MAKVQTRTGGKVASLTIETATGTRKRYVLRSDGVLLRGVCPRLTHSDYRFNLTVYARRGTVMTVEQFNRDALAALTRLVAGMPDGGRVITREGF